MKKTLTLNILAMLILLVAPLLTLAATGSGQGWTNPTSTYGTFSGNFYNVVEAVIKWILGIIGVLAIAGIAVSGIMYVTSGGDEGRTKTAKNWLVYSIVGLVIALIGYAIVTTIGGVLSSSGT